MFVVMRLCVVLCCWEPQFGGPNSGCVLLCVILLCLLYVCVCVCCCMCLLYVVFLYELYVVCVLCDMYCVSAAPVVGRGSSGACCT